MKPNPCAMNLIVFEGRADDCATNAGASANKPHARAMKPHAREIKLFGNEGNLSRFDVFVMGLEWLPLF